MEGILDVLSRISVSNEQSTGCNVLEYLLLATVETMSAFLGPRRRKDSGLAIPYNGSPREPTVSKQHKASISTLFHPAGH